MTQWVKVLGAKPGGPSLIPGSLMEEGENQLHTDAMARSPYPDIINKCKANILSRTFLLMFLYCFWLDHCVCRMAPYFCFSCPYLLPHSVPSQGTSQPMQGVTSASFWATWKLWRGCGGPQRPVCWGLRDLWISRAFYSFLKLEQEFPFLSKSYLRILGLSLPSSEGTKYSGFNYLSAFPSSVST